MARAVKTKTLDVVPTVEPVVWERTGPAAKELVQQIRAVAIAASRDDARQVLTGVRFVANGKLRLEATDSYRLYRLDVAGELPEVTALVPAAFLNRNLPKRFGLSDTLRLTFTDTRFTIEFDDESYSCSLIGGDYPNTSLIVDQDKAESEGHEFMKAYNPKFFADIYKAAALVDEGRPVRVMSGLDALKPTRFEMHGGGVMFTMILMPVRAS